MLVDDDASRASAPRHRRASSEPSARPRSQDRRSAFRRLRPHLPALAVFAVLAFVLLHSMLLHPGTREFAGNFGDEIDFEWMFAAVAHQIVHLHNPLFTPMMGAPAGVNLMANPSVPLVAMLATPLTLALGGSVTIAWLLVLNVFGTAAAWYWFFLRHPAPGARPDTTAYRVAAALGAGLCGFSPAMIAHTAGHPDLSAQWLIPLIADRALAVLSSPRPLRTGLSLGLVVAIGTLIGEELVFLTGIGLGVYFLIWAATHPRGLATPAARLVKGCAGALAVAAPLLAYPLWFQFLGPRSYTGSAWRISRYPANVESYLYYSPFAWAGDASQIKALTPGENEATAFIGLPLLILAAIVLVWRWSDATVRTSAATAGVLAFLSLGATPSFGRHTLLSKSPWSLLSGLPGFSQSLPVRLSIVVFPLLAYLLVTGMSAAAARGRAIGLTAPALVAAALVPMYPTPLATQQRLAVPAFYSAGLWRQCVPQGGTLLAFPYGEPAMQFAVADHVPYAIVGGVFLGPATGTRVVGWPTMRPTEALLADVDRSGTVPTVTAPMRAAAAADFTYWHASCVALLAPGTSFGGHSTPEIASSPVHSPAADLRFLTDLLGAPKLVGDVWTWPVSGAPTS